MPFADRLAGALDGLPSVTAEPPAPMKLYGRSQMNTRIDNQIKFDAKRKAMLEHRNLEDVVEKLLRLWLSGAVDIGLGH